MRLMLLCLALFSMSLVGHIQAQDSEPTALQRELEVRKNAMLRMDQEIRALRSEKESGYISALASFHNSQSDFYEYQNGLRVHAQSVMKWQLISSYVLLILVSLVVFLGLLLSFIEVRAALSAPRRLVAGKETSAVAPATELQGSTGAAIETAQNPVAVHNVELSVERLQITSAVTGVVVLVISLAFLYLFVDRVLELNPTDLTTAHRPAHLSSHVGDVGSSSNDQ